MKEAHRSSKPLITERHPQKEDGNQIALW